MNLNKLVALSGDASFRKFYRNKNSIIVFCKKDRKKNLLIYDAINKILLKNKIKAPKLINQNYHKNYIEIEDLGNISIYGKLKNNKKNRIYYYKKAILLLSKLQKIKLKKVKTFIGSNYLIPKYSKKNILDESNLFLEWYIPKVIKKKNQNKVKNKLQNIFKKLFSKIKNKKKVFVHRDFHVSNLMICKKNIAVIDSQDAAYGNPAYDLASLIDDVRLKTSHHEKKEIFKEYLKLNKKINLNELKNDFEILSVLRNFKIIGIFTRLSIRDNKKDYLKLIPYAWNLIEQRITKGKNFSDLKKFLDKFFLKKIRMEK